MSQSVCFLAFGTFGNPNGFKQTFFIGGDAEIARSIRTFDLKTDAIRLFPNSKLYSIRKEGTAGATALSYSLYTYAKEPHSDRGGTFIGSSILYLDKTAEESATIACLNEFHDKLISKNVQNDVIGVTHSDQFVVSKPSQYGKLVSSLKEIDDLNFGQSSNLNLVVYSDVSAAKLQHLFQQALPLLDVYDAVYFTSAKEVAEFVHQKNLFQLVQTDGFENELQKLQEERQQHILSLTADYETEKERLEEDQTRVLSGLKEQIDANEKTHQKNKTILDESKRELNEVTQTYEGYKKKIDEAIRQLASGKPSHAVKELLAENKRIFTESVNEGKKPVFLNNIPKPKAARTELKADLQADISQPDWMNAGRKHRRHKEYRLDRFKIASFVLLLLWIGTVAYFLFMAKKETPIAEAIPDVQTPLVVQPAPKPAIPELNPKPNGKLSETALRAVLKHIQPHASADSVVKVIFDNNANDIGRYYATQKEAYKKYLIEQNEAYFEKKDSVFYLNKDTLAMIPSYRAEVAF